MKRPPDVTDVVKLQPEFQREDVKKCCHCGLGLAHTGLPFFYRVTIERFALNADACRRADGMERYFGNVELAKVFSTGEPLGKRFDLGVDLLLCEKCSMDSHLCFAVLLEKAAGDGAEPDAEEGSPA